MYSITISLQGLHCSLHLLLVLLVLLLQNVLVWNITPYCMSPCQWCGRDAETAAVKAETENQASDISLASLVAHNLKH